ncbi:MAG TPA: nuclease A inhibitor family protein [Tepidisphaeraceae bacterium]|nr:nuclease A inhibitor family protein [Tepidisphaeraceae bacterium]
MSSPSGNEPTAAQPPLDALRRASEGLRYPSESDEPFDVFCWPAQGAAAGSASNAIAAHVAPDGARRAIENVPVDQFFGDLNESDDAQRFRELRQTLQFMLKGLEVFRVGAGEVRVDVYLIGKADSGDWTGLHTVSIET